MLRSRARLIPLVVLVLAALALLIQAWFHRQFFVDDAFISLRYAQRLAHGRGLTWVDGERVEGYSNLLWVLGCALGMRAGLSGVVAARVLGHLAAIATLGAVAWAHRPSRWADAAPLVFAAMVLALGLPLASWAMGGLEAPLVAATLAWGLVATLRLVERDGVRLRETLPAGAAWAALCLTRPDGALLVAAALAGVVLARGRAGVGLALRLALLPALAIGGQLGFRLLYYGELVPNTALIKLSLTTERVRYGARYLFYGVLGFSAVMVAAAGAGVAAVVDREARRRVLVLSSALVAWTAYVVLVGSDWMPAHRQLIPDLVVLALLAAEALRVPTERGGDWRIRAWIVAGVLLATFGVTQLNDTEAPGGKHSWVWDSRIVGDGLRRAFADRAPLLAVDSAGALSYYSELPALDLMGLTDRAIARHRPPDLGRSLIGHEHGDGRYALSRQPDLVLFCGPRGGHACYRGGQEMEDDPRFHADYVLAAFDFGDARRVRSLVWVRKEGRVGIERAPRAVRVPAWLLADGEAGVARLGDGDRLELVLARGRCAELPLELPAGDWRLAVDGDRATAELAGARLRLCAPAGDATLRSVRLTLP